MDFQTLCSRIHLQKEVQEEAARYYETADFARVRPLVNGLERMETEAGTRAELKRLLGEDRKNIKMLTCMLAGALDIYQWYQEKGIPEAVFFDTMGCFPRFIQECRQITGEYAFDREWWTARQVSGTLFRIGELEYERKQVEARPAVSIHIPSGAAFTKERCSQSLASARAFFAEYFPAYENAAYICRSWLLAPELGKLLPPDSNILAFQRRFQIQSTDYLDKEFIEWVFQTRSIQIPDFPENTRLQKRMKRYLLGGGKIGTSLGVLSG